MKSGIHCPRTRSSATTGPTRSRCASRSGLGELEERIHDAGDGDTIEVPVETLRRVNMRMRILPKNQTEFLGEFGGGRGDRGANCDYKPFNKVNTGDFARARSTKPLAVPGAGPLRFRWTSRLPRRWAGRDA